MLTRMLAYLTLVTYLVVGTVAVRFCLPGSASISFTTSYLNLVSDAPIKVVAAEPMAAPEIKFAKIRIPREPKVVKALKQVVVAQNVHTEIIESEMVQKVSTPNELPFHEPVVLQKVVTNSELPTNLVASYKDFSFTETAMAEVKQDVVSTKLAASENVEPEFFEYPEATVIQPVEPKQTVDNMPAEKTAAVEATPEAEVEEVATLLEQENSEVAEPVVAEAAPQEPEFFDYQAALTTQNEKVSAAPEAKVIQPAPQIVLPADPNLVTFDYPKASQAIAAQTIPTVSVVGSHKRKPSIMPEPNQTEEEESNTVGSNKLKASPVNPQIVHHSYPVSLSIVAMSSDLNKNEPLQDFELRFQDDVSETLEDFGSGEVVIETILSQPKMTRSMTVHHRGHVPTSTDIILQSESVPGSVSIPLIQQDAFNEVQEPFESKGSVGALLIELEDDTKIAKLDVPFGDVIKLDGDFKKTEQDDFRYQLFVGVQSGNAMVSYHRENGEVVSKILHIHENEVTYDANFYEDVVNEKVRLYEDNLLAKESSPLIVSGEQVKIFAVQGSAKKINNHTYKMNFGASHLGGRRYLELNHQSEPVFVGFRENNNINVPSESFMRFILSKVEGAKLGNRCLVQVNLSKKAEKFDVGSESVANSLMTYTQILDEDGKFYDSLSEKTQKIIVVGESQASGEMSPDAKINIKIQYLDGSTQFLNSYCSPNTYLVEQL